MAVSYTHLDVYKRQESYTASSTMLASAELVPQTHIFLKLTGRHNTAPTQQSSSSLRATIRSIPKQSKGCKYALGRLPGSHQGGCTHNPLSLIHI